MMTGCNSAARPWTWTCVAAVSCCLCGPAFSQQPNLPGRDIFYSKVQPLTDEIERVRRDPRPTDTGNALKALDWLIYGSITVGGSYDSNVFSSPGNQTAVYGARFQPAVIAERNTGIQRTLAYTKSDIRYYPSLGEINVLNASGGLVHVWEIQRDLVFRAQGEVTRGRDASLNRLNPNTNYTEPVDYTSLFGSTSIEKEFGRFFTAAGVSVTRNDFEDTRDSLGAVVPQEFRSGSTTTLSGRVGYHLTPLVYTFVEPSLNWGRFNASSLNWDGYQVKAGLGTARIGLFNGEVYGGVMKQEFNDPSIDSSSQAIFGGTVSWYPTRFVTVSTSVSQSLGNSDFTPTAGFGSVTKLNTAKVIASWSATREITLDARFVFDHIEYLNTSRVDDRPEIGLTLTYMLTQRFGIVVDYAHVMLDSNLAGYSYTRDLISVGGKTNF